MLPKIAGKAYNSIFLFVSLLKSQATNIGVFKNLEFF
jgi:hypothetical protein